MREVESQICLLTCLQSLRHSAEMASSQQPKPTHPSDFFDAPENVQNHSQPSRRSNAEPYMTLMMSLKTTRPSYFLQTCLNVQCLAWVLYELKLKALDGDLMAM